MHFFSTHRPIADAVYGNNLCGKQDAKKYYVGEMENCSNLQIRWRTESYTPTNALLRVYAIRLD